MQRRFRDPECRDDASHTEFNRKKAKCSCGASLVVTCEKCKKNISYAYIAIHQAGCQAGQESNDGSGNRGAVLRFAVVASDWKLQPDAPGFSISPKGQYWDGLPESYRGPPQWRVHEAQDPSMSAQAWMDSYDALFAHIACDARFELVKVFAGGWAEFHAALQEKRLAKMLREAAVDLMVVGNWAHDSGDARGTRQRLLQLEMEANVRIFPPMDYLECFTHKERYYPRLARFGPLRMVDTAVLHCIPTWIIAPGVVRWKREVTDAFAGTTAKTIVLKRSLSEQKQHFKMVDLDALDSVSLPQDRASEDGIAWLAQPKIDSFEQHDELRLYIVNGKLLWGVTSNFRSANGMNLFAFGKGLRGGEWNEHLVRAVQLLVDTIVVPRLQTHARHFIRVDLIKKSAGEWYINELEPFGNAFLHFEVASDAYETFPVLVDQVKRWMLET
jgi:hypothetical protein